MLINYALKINGFTVINGYSDIMAPFLHVAGGDACATGWWSNLRTFSLARFSANTAGGRPPVPRYLSRSLFNRIRFDELNILRDLEPLVLNNLPSDEIYPAENGSEPQRAQEIYQTWEAIRSMVERIGNGEIANRILNSCRQIDEANEIYQRIETSLSLDPKSNSEHLPALLEGLNQFILLAELEPIRE